MLSPLEFTSQLAREVGGFLRQNFDLHGTRTSLKPDHSVVTAADLAADRLITNSIREAYPDDAILSEEQRTQITRQAPATWVCDPLDGTTNFSLGLQFWGVSIARLVDGWPDTAAIYFPMLEEQYTAQRGQGAFFNGERLLAGPPAEAQPTSFFSCCSRTHRRYNVKVRYKTRILGAASYTLCAVARGVAILGFEATPKIWDIAAGWLILEEAGAVIATLDDSLPFPLLTSKEYARQDFPTLAAATAEVLEQARSQITPRI